MPSRTAPPPPTRASAPSRASRSRRCPPRPGGPTSRRPSRTPARCRAGLFAPVDRALELLLVHVRAALDPELLGLVVALVARAPLLAIGPGALAAAPRRGHVIRRGARARARLAGAGALLVDRPGGDLLGASLARALLALALLDVLVLPGPLRTLL